MNKNAFDVQWLDIFPSVSGYMGDFSLEVGLLFEKLLVTIQNVIPTLPVQWLGIGTYAEAMIDIKHVIGEMIKIHFKACGPACSQILLQPILQDLLLDLQALQKDPATRIEWSLCRPWWETPVGTNLLAMLTHASFRALALYRFYHAFWQAGYVFHALIGQNYLKWLWLPEIHPNALIAPGTVIDHGSHVVIGEWTYLGSWVYMHHGMTLGAIWPWKKPYLRHPIVIGYTTFGANVSILSSIIYGGTEIRSVGIGTGATLDRCILEPWASVANGVTLTGVRVPPNMQVLRSVTGKPNTFIVRDYTGASPSEQEITFETLSFDELEKVREGLFVRYQKDQYSKNNFPNTPL
jgi:serine acetyltransferase